MLGMKPSEINLPETGNWVGGVLSGADLNPALPEMHQHPEIQKYRYGSIDSWRLDSCRPLGSPRPSMNLRCLLAINPTARNVPASLQLGL